MFEIIQSATFARWLATLKDHQARMRIHARLDRVALGNVGDAEPIRQFRGNSAIRNSAQFRRAIPAQFRGHNTYSLAIKAAMAGGNGAEKCSSCPLAGCWRRRLAECRAWRGRRRRAWSAALRLSS